MDTVDLLTLLRALPGEDIEVGYGPSGEPYLYRKTDFLCGAAETEALSEDLRQLAIETTTRRRPQPVGENLPRGRTDGYSCSLAGCTSWTVRDRWNVLDVVSELRRRVTNDQLRDDLRKNRDELEIGLNHVFTSGGIFQFGPGGMPEPTDDPVAMTQSAVAPQGTALIAVLDTGTLADNLLHPDLRPNLRSHEFSVDDNDFDPVLQRPERPIAGHGVFVAGLLSGDARIRIDPESTLSGAGITDEREVLLDIRDVLDRREGPPDVVNLSLYGYPSPGANSSFPAALQREMERFPNTVWVAAAGNDDVTTPTWPASLPRVIGVASVNAAGERSTFSNHGNWVKACAEGEHVVSTFVRGGVMIHDAEANVDRLVRFNGKAKWSGTSFAAPKVCLAIARMMLDKGLPAPRAAEEVLALGDDKSDLGLGQFIS